MVEVVGVGTALPTNRRFLAVTLGEGEGGPYLPPLWQRQCKEDGSLVVVTVVRLVVGWGGRSDGGTGNSRGSRRQWELLKKREGVRGRAQRPSRNANQV